MMENEGKVDLTKPGTWDRFAHSAIQDALQDVGPNTKVEKSVDVIKDDGSMGRGCVDGPAEDGILEIKTPNPDRLSDRELVAQLEHFARQVESYQWRPNVEGKPEATIFFKFPSKSQHAGIC